LRLWGDKEWIEGELCAIIPLTEYKRLNDCVCMCLYKEVMELFVLNARMFI